MTILLTPKPDIAPPKPTTRGRKGVRNLIYAGVAQSERHDKAWWLAFLAAWLEAHWEDDWRTLGPPEP